MKNNTSYFIFVLGYDLLQNHLKGLPCDIAYELCYQIYTDFLKSNYNDFRKSEYQCLADYVVVNQKEIIEKINLVKC